MMIIITRAKTQNLKKKKILKIKNGQKNTDMIDKICISSQINHFFVVVEGRGGVVTNSSGICTPTIVMYT